MIEQLQQLGFSQYEAQAYLALLKENPASGYELAKNSGIPRPNVYPVLQKLEERGAVLRQDTPSGARYAPVAPDELIAALKERYEKSLSDAAAALQKVAAPPSLDEVYNLRGYPTMLEQARALIDNTQDRLLLSVWPDEAKALAEPVERAFKRGAKMTTLCLRGCPHPCPACRGDVFRYPLAPQNDRRWLVLIPDGKELLAGEIDTSGEARAVRTRQPMLVNLSSSYIKNSIALASILTGLGSRLENELDSSTLAALNRLGASQIEQSWLSGMQEILCHGKNPTNTNNQT